MEVRVFSTAPQVFRETKGQTPSQYFTGRQPFRRNDKSARGSKYFCLGAPFSVSRRKAPPTGRADRPRRSRVFVDIGSRLVLLPAPLAFRIMASNPVCFNAAAFLMLPLSRLRCYVVRKQSQKDNQGVILHLSPPLSPAKPVDGDVAEWSKALPC